MSIQKKLFSIAIIIAITLLGSLAFELKTSSYIEELYRAENEITQISANILLLRRHEKDFLARKEMAYVEKFNATYQTNLTEVSNLKSMLVSQDIDASSIDELSQNLALYQEKFTHVVELQQHIGLHPKDGLYGKLRAAVHEVESELNTLKNDRLGKDMLMLRRNEKDFMLRRDKKYLGKFEKNIEVFMNNLEASTVPIASRAVIIDKMNEYKNSFTALFNAEQQIGLEHTMGLHGELREIIHNTDAMLEGLTINTKNAVDEKVRVIRAIYIIAALLLIIPMVGYILWINRGINRSITAINSQLKLISSTSDLTKHMPKLGKDELAEMAGHIDDMLSKFKNSLVTVNTTADRLANSTGGMTEISMNSACNIQKQQQETEQVATAINEMSATVHSVAQHAEQAAQATQEANQQSTKGRLIVNEAIDAINQLADEVNTAATVINTLSKETEGIGSVLDVIRGIAEQTNLLALNAAIEAARAGEQGRGFAVVADEVRTLASRTQDSTQEIQQMIEGLQQEAREAVQVMERGTNQAATGVGKAALAGESLQAIIKSITHINDMNSMIATAAEEQSAVAEEISQNINNISQIAEETTVDSNKVSHESQELSALAFEMKKMIHKFKI